MFQLKTVIGRMVLPGRTMEEYDHYAKYMNVRIDAAGGCISTEEHNRLTLEYNKKFGKQIETVTELERAVA